MLHLKMKKQKTGNFQAQQKQIERVLEKSLQELANIKFALDAAAIVAITNHQGKIIYANDKFCEISKYSHQELLGQDHRIINSGYHSKEFFRNLWRTIANGKVWRAEIRNKAKDGSFYWVDTTIVPFLNEKGKPYEYVAIRYEITKRKQMEDALKELSQRIIQAQEQEREKISREIHDDLGQSLATLKMLIQSEIQHAGRKKDVSNEQIIRYLNGIIDKTRALSATLRPSALEVLGLSTSLKTMVAEFRMTNRVAITLRSAPLDGLMFYGEVINLFRIVQESLNNAVKHAAATKIEIRIQKKKDRLVVMITDNGRGFDLNKKRDVKSSRRGLGLSTMAERARLLEGELKIDSSLRKGTQVTLNIPLKIGGV